MRISLINICFICYISFCFLSLGISSCKPANVKRDEVANVLRAFYENRQGDFLIIDSLFFLNGNGQESKNQISPFFLELFKMNKDDMYSYDSSFIMNTNNNWRNYYFSKNVVPEYKIREVFRFECEKIRKKGLEFDCENLVVFPVPFIKCSMPYFSKDYSRAFVISHEIFSMNTATHQIFEFSHNKSKEWKVIKVSNY